MIVLSFLILSVPVQITWFQFANEVFTNTSSEAVYCAEGYPEPSVTVTTVGMVVENVNKTSSSGPVTVCRKVTFMARNHCNFNVSCQAMLSSYNCTPVPPAALALCGNTTDTTTMTKITANGKSSS